MSDVSARPTVPEAPASLDGVTELHPPAGPAMRRFLRDLPADDVALPAGLLGRVFPPPPVVAAVHTVVAVQLLAIDAGCAAVIAAAQRVRRLVAPAV